MRLEDVNQPSWAPMEGFRPPADAFDTPLKPLRPRSLAWQAAGLVMAGPLNLAGFGVFFLFGQSFDLGLWLQVSALPLTLACLATLLVFRRGADDEGSLPYPLLGVAALAAGLIIPAVHAIAPGPVSLGQAFTMFFAELAFAMGYAVLALSRIAFSKTR